MSGGKVSTSINLLDRHIWYDCGQGTVGDSALELRLMGNPGPSVAWVGWSVRLEMHIGLWGCVGINSRDLT